MALQFLLGSGLVFLSVAVQAGFVGGAVAALEARRRWISRPPHGVKAAGVVGAAALWLLAAHSIGVWLWAVAFIGLGVFDDFDTALYFAAVAFTTLGFGDVVPPPAWRHLAGLCAANGLLAFGVSAAVLVEVLRKIGEASQAKD